MAKITECFVCGCQFYLPNDKDHHWVYNAAHHKVNEVWCLSEFGMEAIGMQQKEDGRWFMPWTPIRPVEGER